VFKIAQLHQGLVEYKRSDSDPANRQPVLFIEPSIDELA
jgi:hypothetical protein